MMRLMKILVIWMLMLVLPAQAIASAIRLSCGPAHHPVSAAAAMAVEHVHHGMDQHSDHHHELLQQAANDSASDTPKESTQFKSSFCSACASCCVGALAPPSIGQWHSDHHSSFAPLVAFAPFLAGHIPPGLERPPRNFLA